MQLQLPDGSFVVKPEGTQTQIRKYQQESSNESDAEFEPFFEYEKNPVHQTILRILYAEGDFRKPSSDNIPIVIDFLKTVVNRFRGTD